MCFVVKPGTLKAYVFCTDTEDPLGYKHRSIGTALIRGFPSAHSWYGSRHYLPLVSREWKNGSNSSYNCTPFLHSLLTKGKIIGLHGLGFRVVCVRKSVGSM